MENPHRRVKFPLHRRATRRRDFNFRSADTKRFGTHFYAPPRSLPRLSVSPGWLAGEIRTLSGPQARGPCGPMSSAAGRDPREVR